MRIVILGNNWVAWQLTAWLRERGESIVGLAIHPMAKRRYGDEIVSASNLDSSRIIDGSKLVEAEILDKVRDWQPDIGLSFFFGYIFRPDFINLFPSGVINLHPAYLPYNRGTYPNVWSIIEGTPSGVTLHHVDSDIDGGDIIAQHQVPVEAVDTGETLYRKLEAACVELFKETWPVIRSGQASRTSQTSGAGTYHRARDVDKIDEIDLSRQYQGRELIDILRARSFKGHQGAYFRDGDRKVFLRLELGYEDCLEKS